MSRYPIALAIMAGGSSSRMGHDKALLNAGRGPNLERLAQLGNNLHMPVMVVGRERPPTWPSAGDLSDVVFMSDDLPGQGPLGGVVSALAHADQIICLACDLFSLEVAGVLWLRQQVEQLSQSSSPLTGVVVKHAGGLEPLCAYYTVACVDEAQRRLSAGERALQRLISACNMTTVDAPPWLVRQLANVNTPAEWQQHLQDNKNKH